MVSIQLLLLLLHLLLLHLLLLLLLLLLLTECLEGVLGESACLIEANDADFAACSNALRCCC